MLGQCLLATRGILRQGERLQEEYLDKEKKLYMCFVDLEKAFDRVLNKVLEWAIRKKGIPEVMVRAMMSLYEGAKSQSWARVVRGI